MPDTPALLPVPCTGNTIMLGAWKCKSDGSGWEEIYVPAADVGSLSLASAGSPCGGSCPKTAAIETAREMRWSADELVKVLKALGG